MVAVDSMADSLSLERDGFSFFLAFSISLRDFGMVPILILHWGGEIKKNIIK